MIYQGYGSTSKEAERHREMARLIAPKIGGPVAGIGGGMAQLAQALLARSKNKKADKAEAAHKAEMAAALQNITAGMSPDKAAFFKAFPQLASQAQAANMFPNQMKQKQMQQQQANTVVNQNLAQDKFDNLVQQQAVQNAQHQAAVDYQKQRHSVADSQFDTKMNYQKTQDAATNQLRGRQIDATIAKANKTDLGKTPIYLRGQDGSVSIGQLGNGQVVPAKIAEGMTIVDPMQKAQMQQQGRSQGKIQGESFQNFPAIETNANRALKTVDQLLNHKGIDAGTGFSAKIPAIPGSDKYAFNVANKQAQGQVFLQGFEALKGGGVITEVEGLKAEQALARMDTAQSREDYEAGLRDYKAVIENGMIAARRKAGIETGLQGGAQTFTYNPQTGGFD